MSQIARESASKGEETHARIVEHARILASTVGLEGLTIGALATDLGLSKSGLFAHFKSKEKLQLDVLDAAAEHFRREVFVPALSKPRGEPRMRAIFENWLAWALSKDLPGGCIFLAGALEWDDREGPVRDKLTLWFRALSMGLARAAGLGVSEGHLRADLDLSQFASDWHAIVIKYHLDARLLRDERALVHARRAFERLLNDARPGCVSADGAVLPARGGVFSEDGSPEGGSPRQPTN